MRAGGVLVDMTTSEPSLAGACVSALVAHRLCVRVWQL